MQGSKLNIKNRGDVIKRILFIICISFVLCLIGYFIFSPLYYSDTVIIDYGIHSFNICTEQPIIWKYCRYWFVFTYIFSSIFISNMIFYLLHEFLCFFKPKKPNFKNEKYKKEKISYSFIEKKPQNEELKLLIRRKF